MVVEDLLDGDRRNPLALQHQHRLDAISAVSGVIERQGEDAIAHLGRRRLRVRLVDRRQVLQASETFELEPALPLVKARPIHAAAAARLRSAPQLLGQLENAQTLTRHFLMGIHAASSLCQYCTE